jgi:hypothetical protein
VVGSFEHFNEPSVSIKRGKFHDQLSALTAEGRLHSLELVI